MCLVGLVYNWFVGGVLVCDLSGWGFDFLALYGFGLACLIWFVCVVCV